MLHEEEGDLGIDGGVSKGASGVALEDDDEHEHIVVDFSSVVFFRSK